MNIHFISPRIQKEFENNFRKYIFLFGVSLLLTTFTIQQTLIESFKSADKIVLTETQIIFMDGIALHTLGSYAIGVILISLGIILYIQEWTRQTHFSYSSNRVKKYYHIFKSGIYLIFTNSDSRRFFMGSFIVYFTTSLFLNNTIIYDNNHNQDSLHLAMDNISFTPSLFILGCCGNPGTFPVVSIHLTESLGIKLIPANIILPFFYSFLVSTALGTIVLNISNRKNEKTDVSSKSSCTMASFGVMSGFFISCPTCTTNIIVSSVLSTGIITSSSLIMYSYQPIIAIFNFVAIFLGLIYMMKRNLYKSL